MKIGNLRRMTSMIFLLCLLTLLFLTACYASQPQPQESLKEQLLSQTMRRRRRVNLNQDMVLRTLYNQGLERSYYLYTPGAHTRDRPMPLLLAFHGGVGQGDTMAAKTGFNDLADREDFLVVYPNGIDLGAIGP
jgi:polyhydroxybutyrate depolymerase